MAGTAMPPTPCLPEAAETPPCVSATPTPGVPAVLFRLARNDVLAFPADPVVFGLRPERVRAFGFAATFVLADAGAFFDGFVAMTRPDRGPVPFALPLAVAP